MTDVPVIGSVERREKATGEKLRRLLARSAR